MPNEKLRPAFTFTEDRLKELESVVPEAFADGRVNWDTLREALGETLDDEGRDAEHFGLNWPGKREARRLASKPSHGTLLPAPGEGVNEDKTSHLFIEGDNLEVLKLLQKSYAGRVKMIYIDPPYNTGNDFVYKDDFSEPLESYLERSGQSGERGELLTTNPKAGGRFHSNWLNMIYPRLRLARTLLRDDGVIFVSIDDNEVHHLRSVMNEVFGEEHFIAQICHKSRASVSNDKIISSNHNHILLYAKNKLLIEDKDARRQFGLPPDLTGFNLKDKNGQYKHVPVDGPGDEGKGNPHYTFLGVTDYFRFSEERMKRMYDEGLIVKVGNALQQKYYLETAKKSRKTDTTWWDQNLYTSTATGQLKVLLGGAFFDNPKPVPLLTRIIDSWARQDGDIVLDFFAGSCTLAEAALQLNRSNSRSLQFIVAQVPEPTDKKSPAYKAGYRTIADIGKERIRRVIKQMKKQPPLPRDTPEDLGFRVLKLASSHFKQWREAEGQDLDTIRSLFDDFETPLCDGWTPNGLLTETLLLEGFPLDSTVEAVAVSTNAVQRVTSPACGHALFACFDKKLKPKTVQALDLSAQDVFVCLDSALGDDLKLRLSQSCTLKTI